MYFIEMYAFALYESRVCRDIHVSCNLKTLTTDCNLSPPRRKTTPKLSPSLQNLPPNKCHVQGRTTPTPTPQPLTARPTPPTPTAHRAARTLPHTATHPRPLPQTCTHSAENALPPTHRFLPHPNARPFTPKWRWHPPPPPTASSFRHVHCIR